uniref:Uncharacterized protein n=1 Tax=Panagrellus redivivus TaxID=6233 RepID=A0A7E4VFQ1_PANRE
MPCMRTGGGGGAVPTEPTVAPTVPTEAPTTVPTTIPTTTVPTTTPQPCPASMTMASIFVASNVELQPEVYGAVAPARQCTTCANGMVNYYDSASTDVPHSTTPLEAAGSLSAVNCPNMCICGTDGVCYNPTGNDVVATLWPYCSGGTCGTYVLITANTDAAGFVSTTGSPTFASGDQVGPDFDFNPVTDPSYINAATISCDGCVASSCQTSSP